MYVSNSGSGFMSHFIMDEATGKLDPQANIEMEGGPGAVATDAACTMMYIGCGPRIDSCRIDRASGALEKIGSTTIVEGTPFIAIDNTDRYLLAAYYGAAGITSHRIESDGALSSEPLQWLDTAVRSHSIHTDASNRFAFVPHTNPTNAIYQFRFDEKTGLLSPNDPPLIQPQTEEGPRHFVIRPRGDVLYSVNENGMTVSAFHFDAERGTLEAFQLIGTLPEGEDPKGEGLSTAEIRMTSDGRYLYASNRGHNTLALFAVGDDGTLTLKDHFPTEPVPRFFEIDPTEQYVYSAGQDSGRLVSYKLDSASGALETLENHEVGTTPLWIQFVKQA